jgi:itaconate CoA-transferase
VSRPPNEPILEGITVVAVEQAVAAPFATRQLADHGARVIKVERPGGGDFARTYDSSVAGLSSYFVWLNRGKESIVLDLSGAFGRRAVAKLISHADVFIQNLAPGAAERLGFAPDDLRAANPRLIVCEISGYGKGGPYESRKAYDLLIQAEGGLMSVTGDADPARVGVSIADIAAGTYAFSGIVMALYRRERLGVGSHVQVSLFDALIEWMSSPLYYTMGSGKAVPRSGPRHPTIAPYGPFRCRGGVDVFIAVQNDREWDSFCVNVISLPELTHDRRFATNSARVADRADLERLISQVVLTVASEELEGRLDAAGIAHSRLRDIRDVAVHPELIERHRWTSVDSPNGPVVALIPPLHIDGANPLMSAVPALGEHTAGIVSEFGLLHSDELDRA